MAICGSANWGSGPSTSVMDRACSMDKMVAKDIRKDMLVQLNTGSVGRLFIHIIINHYCKAVESSGSEGEIMK